MLDAIQEERIESEVKSKVGETNQAVPFILNENAFRDWVRSVARHHRRIHIWNGVLVHRHASLLKHLFRLLACEAFGKHIHQ